MNDSMEALQFDLHRQMNVNAQLFYRINKLEKDIEDMRAAICQAEVLLNKAVNIADKHLKNLDTVGLPQHLPLRPEAEK